MPLTGAASIETGGGLLEGADLDGEVEVSIGEPRFAWDDIPLAYADGYGRAANGLGEPRAPMALSVGNPHVVFFVDDLDAVPLESRARNRERRGLPRADQRQRRQVETRESGCVPGSAAPA